MGMETSACYADVISYGFVSNTCPDELIALQEALKKADYDLESLAMITNYDGDLEGELEIDLGDDEANTKAIVNAYENLCFKFQEKTDLTLDLCYHAKEDRGDEVDGHFWAVGGVYVLSKAGEKYKDRIERKHWTIWG